MARRSFGHAVLFLTLLTPAANGQVSLVWEPIFQNTNALAFALNPMTDSILYAPRSGRLHVSYDAGQSWQIRGAVPGTEIRNISVCPADTAIILMYANGSVLRSTDGGFGWTEVLTGVTMDGETIEFHPQNPDTAYFVDFRSGDLHVSPDRGATWSLRSNVSSTFVCSFSVNRFNPLLMIAGAGNTRINRSTDGGYSWENVKDGNDYFSEIPKLKWDPTDSSRAFAATYLDRFFSSFRTTDVSATWEEPGIFGIFMWALDVEPDQGHVYMGSFGDPSRPGVFKTYDAGDSWQKFGTTLDRYCWMIKAANDSVVTALALPSGFGVGAIYRISIPPLGYVAGTISDSLSGDRVEISSIGVQETGDHVSVGNSAGSYRLALPAGTYTLRFTANGVETVISGVNVVTGTTQRLDVAIPLDIRQQTLVGTVLDTQGAPVVSRVLLDYTQPQAEMLTLVDTTESDGTYGFDSLNSLNSYQNITVEPLVLPYLGQIADTVLVDSRMDFVLEKADLIELTGPGPIPNGNRYGLALQSLGVTSIIVEGGDTALSSAVIGETTRQALIWYAEHDSGMIPPAILDTLAAACRDGNHLIMSGKNMLEKNDSHTLFRDHLGVAFQDDYNVAGFASLVTGFPGSPIGTGLELRITRLNQDSADILSPLTPAVRKSFYYGNADPDTVNLAGVHISDTGGSGRAVLLGLDLHLQQTSLIAEVLRRSFNFFDDITSVGEVASLPDSPELQQNYPNPFNPGTAIRFSIVSPSPVVLKIYNTLGQEVRTLVAAEQKDAGTHTALWDGTDDQRRPVASGVYVYRLTSGTSVETKRMILLR
jgi:hypothetical protein